MSNSVDIPTTDSSTAAATASEPSPEPELSDSDSVTVTQSHIRPCIQCGHHVVESKVVDFIICSECFDQAAVRDLEQRKSTRRGAKPSYADYVIDHVYIGDEKCASSKEHLLDIGITHILVVGAYLEPFFINDGCFQYKTIDVDDSPHADLSSHFDECVQFIDDAGAVSTTLSLAGPQAGVLATDSVAVTVPVSDSKSDSEFESDTSSSQSTPCADSKDTENQAQLQTQSQGLRQNKVLVHCASGISRSGTIIIAYLTMKHAMSYEQAYTFAQQQRSAIHPNSGFQRQLKELATATQYKTQL
jgi:ribosomal protein S26